jgi:hypothetical protein
LLLAAGVGELETVKWLLQEGGAKIGDANNDGNLALICAAHSGELETVKWLLEQGGASIGEADNDDCASLLAAAEYGELATTQYLLEHGGANLRDTDNIGDTTWDLLPQYLIEGGRNPGDEDDDTYVYDGTAVTSLLRVMVLRGTPPAELTTRLSPEHAQVVQEGVRLKAGLPAYLAQRRALLDAHCPLIPPLQALVHG